MAPLRADLAVSRQHGGRGRLERRIKLTHRSYLVLCLFFDLVERVAAASDLGDDVLCGCLPDERFRVLIPVFGPSRDRVCEVGEAGEDAPTQPFVCQFLEPSLDKVQPGTRRRGGVKVPAAAFLCASHALISGVECAERLSRTT